MLNLTSFCVSAASFSTLKSKLYFEFSETMYRKIISVALKQKLIKMNKNELNEICTFMAV